MRRRTGEALAIAAALAVALAAAPARAGDGVSVSASVDRTELAQDEPLVLTLRVEADEAPSAIDLREDELPFAIRSRSESRSASFAIGGGGGVRLRRTSVVSLVLAPARAGDLEIPALAVTVKGIRHLTQPIRVKVLPAGAGARAPAAPADPRGGTWSGWQRDLVLQVEVDRREVFLGEQVTASVWLLSPAGVADYQAFRPPALDGLWVEELERPRQVQFRLREVNGVPTRAYLVQKIALFPTRAGDLEIGPYEIEVGLRIGSPSLLAPFGGVQHATRRSAPVKLRVKPLPPGAPAGFAAVNVGVFKLEAAAAEAEVVAGQPVAVRVTASGEGNVRALALPALPPLDGARRFEPTASEAVAVRSGRLGGSRTLETVIVPEEAGELSIPALAWPSFDPRAGRYVVARTAPLRLRVRPAPAAPPGPAPADPLAGLRPPRAASALARPAPPPWRGAPFLALVVLPPLGLALLAGRDAWRRRAEAGAPARRARGAGRLARRRLAAADRRLAAGERARFLDETERALVGWAADRLGRSISGLTREDLGAALAAAGARPAAVAALSRALDACDAARFGGGAVPDDEVRALAASAVALLEASADRGGEAAP